MKRLTDEYWRNLDPWECCGQDKYCNRGCHDEGGCANGCIVPKLYARLAAYEDTGLEPEEIKNLKNGIIPDHWAELFKAECEGRLIVLPCKEGTPIWKLSPRLNSASEIEERFYNVASDRCLKFGKDFFLTREEAEAALKGEEGVENDG